MKTSAALAVCLIATLCASLAYAQQTASPNAYVYVIANPAANSYEIDGYKADSTGALTRLTGSPFWKTSKTLYAMAHTTNWFFVSDGTNIYTFSIASTGALKQVSSVDAAKFYEFQGLTGLGLTLDHTGSTLYSLAMDGSGDNEFQFFAKNSNNGSLSFLGLLRPASPSAASFLQQTISMPMVSLVFRLRQLFMLSSAVWTGLQLNLLRRSQFLLFPTGTIVR